MKTQSARAAHAIKAELKSAFPTTKFSVVSDNFAGGDAVLVKYEDGPLADQVRDIVSKYQYGSVNSMEDIYEYDNKIEGLDQVKYVNVKRSYSLEARAIVSRKLNVPDDNEWNERFRNYNSAIIWSGLKDINFAPTVKVYRAIKRNQASSTVVPELNAKVYLATFYNNIGIDWQWAALYESINSGKELIGIGSCSPVNSKLLDVVKIHIR